MKLLPLIGSLILSAAPVQAIEQPQDFKTFDELDLACGAALGGRKLCRGSAQYFASFYMTALLCQLEKEGMLTTEHVAKKWEEIRQFHQNADTMFKEGIKDALKQHATCSIKPEL